MIKQLVFVSQYYFQRKKYANKIQFNSFSPQRLLVVFPRMPLLSKLSVSAARAAAAGLQLRAPAVAAASSREDETTGVVSESIRRIMGATMKSPLLVSAFFISQVLRTAP